MSSETDPTAFDPEQTSSIRVGTLSERFTEAMAEPDLPANPPMSGYVSPYDHGRGPSVVYQHSDGQTFSVVDRVAPGGSIDDPEDKLRELMLARALLRHALHLVDKELNQVGPV